MQGIDTFDCVHPTRLARHGGALVRPPHNPSKTKEHLNLRNGQFKDDHTAIEPDCPCSTCQSVTKAYIHHLLKAQELVALTLISIHNINFMNRLMAAIRLALQSQQLEAEKKNWVLE